MDAKSRGRSRASPERNVPSAHAHHVPNYRARVLELLVSAEKEGGLEDLSGTDDAMDDDEEDKNDKDYVPGESDEDDEDDEEDDEEDDDDLDDEDDEEEDDEEDEEDDEEEDTDSGSIEKTE